MRRNSQAAPSPSPASFGTDEDSWFGGDDREAEARAEQSVAALGAKIIGAKPFPIAAKRLEELTRNPKARLEQVVSVLETDPGLSVRLLRLVNSAGYGLKVRVTSVRHAAVLVGTRRLHQVATTAAILDLFETSNETAVELLEHATVVGSLCRYLAVHLGLPHDELFTCGFLHDIGKLMLLDTEGDKYAALVREHGHAPDQMHVQERKLFGFDHAVLGAHVLTAWNIPEPVPKVVAFHHNPARAMQDTLLSSMVYTLRLADLMSYAVHAENELDGIAQVTESEAAQYLEISEPQVAAMWQDLRALADRSRARSHGQPDMEVVAPRRLDVPRSLRPRRSGAPRSLPPPSVLPTEIGPNSQRPPSSSSRIPASQRAGSGTPSEVNEMPTHFPCVACSKPSFGNVCPACEGQVCPEHQVGPEHWCTLCAQEYVQFRQTNQVPGYLKVTALALAGFSVGASITGVMVSQTFAVWKLIVAPISIILLWGVLLPVAHRLWQRKRFVSTRPKGRIPVPVKMPRANQVFISSLDANLETDGLMGASMPPSSRGISIVGPTAPLIASDAANAEHQTPVPLASPTPTITLATASTLLASPVPEAPSAPPADPSVPAPAPGKDAEITAVSGGPIDPELLARANAAAAELAAREQAKREQFERERAEAAVRAEAAARAEAESERLEEAARAEAAALVRAERERIEREEQELAQAELDRAERERVAAAEQAATAERERAAAEQAAALQATEEKPAAAAAPPAEEQGGPWRGAAASLNPPSVRPPRDNVAAHIASMLGEPSGLSEFPSVGSASELENVVASVSARLGREFPQNDYMGPSADLRAASIAPIPEREAARAQAPVIEETPAPPVSEVTASAQAVVPSESEPQPEASPLPLRLVFPRQALEQHCAPVSSFRCAIPVHESCSPAPRRTAASLRPPGHTAGESVPPRTVRGLG